MNDCDLAALQSGTLLPDDAMLFIASAWVDLAISDDADPGLIEILDFMSAICQKHGVETWLPGEGPHEFEALRAEWAQQWGKVQARFYSSQGQPVLAWLIQNDRADYARRYTNGARYLRGKNATGY